MTYFASTKISLTHSSMLPESVKIHPDPKVLLTEFFEKRSYSQVAVLMDQNTKTHCYGLVKNILPPHFTMEVSAGENHKNLETCASVWDQMTQYKMDRHSLLLVMGGGVLGDLGGFCAATFKRGIDFLLMPTTLLAQVDASIGGKLGIDFNGFKNHIGVFQIPKATLISDAFLKTLPERELRSGFAEVIKHCIISDRNMWETIRKSGLAGQDWNTLIAHSASFKSSVVAEDPRESGRRKILNFGHTIGHALETYFLETKDRLYHGEAIAAGMIAESFIAVQEGLLTESESDEISDFINKIYEKTPVAPADKIIEIVYQDKKNKGNKILMALPDKIGNALWDVEISEDLIRAALMRL